MWRVHYFLFAQLMVIGMLTACVSVIDVSWLSDELMS
jgi:hypothetical protein